ncbi:MAG: hypothetical protein HY907_03865 [Deltaproteobacteria bacterium]|nr:hypothetical protein [Deltaproteobacteria bacterium]
MAAKLGRATSDVNRGPRFLPLLAGCLAVLAAASPAVAGPRYEIEATLRPDESVIEGTATLDPGPDGAPAAPPLLLLYPQRFAARPPEFDERRARWIYPGGFDPGSLTITSCRTASGAPCDVALSPDGTTATVATPEEEDGPVTVGFRTRVPERFGAFGRDGDQLVLGGGWHPLLAARDPAGAFDAALPVERADYAVTLHLGPGWSAIVDGLGPYACGEDAAAGCRVEHSSAAAEPPSIVAAPAWHERSVLAAGVRVRVLSTESTRPPATYAVDAGRGLDPASVPDLWSVDRTGWMLDVLADALRVLDEEALLPPEDRRAGEVTLIVAPLRLEPTLGISGAVLVSDQAYELFPIEPFFRFLDAEIARAVTAELARGALPRLPLAEARWTAELIAAGAVERLAETAGEGGRRAEEWLKYGAFLPVIDQMIYAPTMQFRDTYYAAVEETDSLHDEVWRFNTDLPRGRRLWAKLRDRLGATDALAAAREILASGETLEAAAARAADADLADFRTGWLGRYPAINLRLGEWGSERLADGTWRTTIALSREGDPDAREFVTVRVELEDGTTRDEVWDAREPEGEIAFTAAAPASSVELDPESRVVQDPALVEENPRADDVSSLAWRLPVFDRFHLSLDLTTIANSEIDVEFTMRRRYDLHQFFRARFTREPRGIGGNIGYRYGFGPPRDMNRPSWFAGGWVEVFRHDEEFAVGDDGGTGSPTTMELGAVVGHDDRWFDLDPADGWYVGLSASGSFPIDPAGAARPWTVRGAGRGYYLWSPAPGHTLAVFGGFGVTFGEPVASQYEALGDRLLLAAIDPDEGLGRAKLYLVGEYRHLFSWDLDANLFHLAWLRGLQGVLTVGLGTTTERDSFDGMFGLERLFFEFGYGLRAFLDYAGVQTGLIALDLAVPLGFIDGRFGFLDRIRIDPEDRDTWRPRSSLFGIPFRLHLAFNQTF